MGCTDERSVSSKTQKKRNRGLSGSESNKNIDKRNSLNNKENINQIDDDVKKYDHNPLRNMQHNNNDQINNEYDDDDDDDEKDENEINNDDFEEDKSNTDEFEEDEMDPDVPEMNREIYREISPYLQSRVNPNFNFPEVKEDVYVGCGLRRMKAFKSTIPKDELKQRREAFWGTRVEGNEQVWQFLREICELPVNEDENIKPMLEANEITPLKNCINVTFDRGGEVYEIPNYCINEPISFDLPETHMKKPEKKKISFHGRKGTEQFKIKTENYTKIENIRKNVGKKFDKDPSKVRLFFRGKEMKDGNELWQYNVQDEDVIIIMCLG
jgi:hypothetical protein